MRPIAPLLLLLLLMFAGAASADDYYVATWGDNNAQGNITHPWQNVSYATQQAVAGDTIHLFDGTWNNEHAVFANSGNATHPITLTAYNGTPTLDGLDKSGIGVFCNYKNYIRISGLRIHRYKHSAHIADSYNTISDCVLYDSGDALMIVSTQDSTYNTIENCTLYDSGWNTIQMSGNHEPPGGNGVPATHITVRNCTIYNSNVHNAIDLYGNVQHVLIEDCTIHNSTAGGIFRHDDPDHQEYIIIRDNIFRDMNCYAISLYDSTGGIWVSDAEIYNNTFTDVTVNNVIEISNMQNLTVTNNSFYSSSAAGRIWSGATNITYDKNYVAADCGNCIVSGGSKLVIRAPLGKKSISLKNSNTVAEYEYTDGTVFTASLDKPQYATWIPVRYYPDRSNCSATKTAADDVIMSMSATYNITLIPTNSYLKDVSINHESDAPDDRTNISADSSVSDNPTTITATMQNSSHTYNVSVDGIYTTQVVSNAAKVATYQYSSSWSAHTFEFDWFSDAGFSGAPDPTNLQSTKSSTWVNHTWDAGTGNITDSYNVSINSVWHNTTTNAYYYHTGMSPETWSNITVWAYNNTGGISQNSISQNIQTDAAGWSPSNTVAYFNNTAGYAIEITTKTDGTNLSSRTPTEADGNATSGRMVVKTS